MAGAIGETGHCTGQIVGRIFGNGRGHAGSAQRNGNVAHAHAKSEGRHGVVASARCDGATALNVLAGDFRTCLDCGGVARSKHGRQHDRVGMLACRFGTFRWFKHHGDQIAAVFVGSGIVIDGAGSVGTVGEQRFQVCVLAFCDWTVACDTPAQPIVRQADRGDLLGVFRLVFSHPRHFGQREGSNGGGSDGLDPALLATRDHIFRFALFGGSLAHLLDEGRGLRRRAYVVPQHGVANHTALLIENHHAVLLTADGKCLNVVKSTGLLGCLKERVPPVFRVDRRAIGVLGLAETHHFAGFGVGHAHFARLGRGVDAGHESSSHCASLQ